MAVGETGLPKLREIRRHIEVLRDRLDWLTSKAIDMERHGKDPFYEKREMEALIFTLPILEAEWDVLARMRREEQKVQGRLVKAERRGEYDIMEMPDAYAKLHEPYADNVPESVRR